MKTLLQPNGDLKITIDQTEKISLGNLKLERRQDFTLFDTMYDFFDKFNTNSQYEWINPIEVNLQSQAPTLATFGTQRKVTPYDEPNLPIRGIGYWDGAEWVKDIEHYWIWVDYKNQPLLEVLLTTGEAIFEKGM